MNAWFALAALLAILSNFLLRHYPDWVPSVRIIVALSPFVPFLFYVKSCARFIRKMDEMQRRIQLESWLMACLGTLFVGTAINILYANGIAVPAFRHGLGLMGTFVLAFALSIAGSAIINRRYQ